MYPFSKVGVNLEIRETFADIGATVLDFFGLRHNNGVSFKGEIL